MGTNTDTTTGQCSEEWVTLEHSENRKLCGREVGTIWEELEKEENMIKMYCLKFFKLKSAAHYFSAIVSASYPFPVTSPLTALPVLITSLRRSQILAGWLRELPTAAWSTGLPAINSSVGHNLISPFTTLVKVILISLYEIQISKFVGCFSMLMPPELSAT